jgi:hypothetical protein
MLRSRYLTSPLARLTLLILVVAGCDQAKELAPAEPAEADDAETAGDVADEVRGSGDAGGGDGAAGAGGDAEASERRAAAPGSEPRLEPILTPAPARKREGAPTGDGESASEGRPSQPTSVGSTIEIRPSAPSAGETIQVRAGPLTFRNGCEGIARSMARGPDAGGTILIGWQPREVSPDEMCMQAFHDMWIEVELEALAAGEYELEVAGVGARTLSVSPRD